MRPLMWLQVPFLPMIVLLEGILRRMTMSLVLGACTAGANLTQHLQKARRKEVMRTILVDTAISYIGGLDGICHNTDSRNKVEGKAPERIRML